ncbi:MAG TPA: O-antigen ligase family protein, partial [Longimicrobiaceae bacterium]|nr:O-antigen ligase family protein [Longimicrobiaceae bacterium]
GGPGRRSAADVWSATPRAIWAFVRKEPAGFWFLNLYFFFEYVRPQSIYSAINVAPWAQIFLLLSLASLFMAKKPLRFPTVAAAMLVVYSLVLVASSVTAWSPEASFAMYTRYFNWVLIFILVVNIVDTERRFFVFMLAFLLYSFKMSQHGARGWVEMGFGFRDWGVTGGPGWFQNSGEFGIQMCVFFPLSVGFVVAMWKKWGKWQRLFFLTFPVTAVMSIIASSSRGALLGGALVLGWMALRSRHRVRAIAAAAVLAVVVVTVIPAEQKERFSTAGEDDTSEARLTLWKNGLEIAGQYPVLGIGYGNWSPYNEAYYGRPLLPHNIFIEAVAELGYVGLFALVLLIGATFVVNFKTRKVLKTLPGDNAFLHQMAHGLDGAMLGFMGGGFFVTVLYYPFLWVNLAMTVALHVAALQKARELRAASGAPRFPAPPQPAPAPAYAGGHAGRVRPGPRGGWR